MEMALTTRFTDNSMLIRYRGNSSGHVRHNRVSDVMLRRNRKSKRLKFGLDISHGFMIVLREANI